MVPVLSLFSFKETLVENDGKTISYQTKQENKENSISPDKTRKSKYQNVIHFSNQQILVWHNHEFEFDCKINYAG